jgi:hypothetical protein
LNLLCLLGFHKWEYSEKCRYPLIKPGHNHRECLRCGREEQREWVFDREGQSYFIFRVKKDKKTKLCRHHYSRLLVKRSDGTLDISALMTYHIAPLGFHFSLVDNSECEVCKRK